MTMTTTNDNDDNDDCEHKRTEWKSCSFNTNGLMSNENGMIARPLREILLFSMASFSFTWLHMHARIILHSN